MFASRDLGSLIPSHCSVIAETKHLAMLEMRGVLCSVLVFLGACPAAFADIVVLIEMVANGGWIGETARR